VTEDGPEPRNAAVPARARAPARSAPAADAALGASSGAAGPAQTAGPEAAEAAEAAEGADAASPLRHHPAFLRFWWARLAGTTANQMLMLAIGWQLYGLTGSAWDLGLVGLLQFLPALALVLLAGHVADRFERRRVLALCMAVQVAIAGLLVLSTLQGWAGRGLLLGLSVAIGTAKAFQMPAQQAIVPLLVPEALLPRALAMSSAGMQVAIIGGPALGGFLFAAGTAVVYAACVLAFAAAGVLFAGLRHAQPRDPKEPLSLRAVFAGVHFIRRRPVVLGAISLDLFAVLLGGATALLPIFAKDVLGVGAWDWACCARRRRPARWRCPAGCRGDRSGAASGGACSPRSRSTGCACSASRSPARSGCRWPCWR
jgi:MFS family permease